MNNYNHVVSPMLTHEHNHRNHDTTLTTCSTLTARASPVPPPSSDSCFKKFFRCIQGNDSYRKLMMKRSQLSGVNSVSMIDKVSRVLFPLAFTGLNVMYWIAYTR